MKHVKNEKNFLIHFFQRGSQHILTRIREMIFCHKYARYLPPKVINVSAVGKNLHKIVSFIKISLHSVAWLGNGYYYYQSSYKKRFTFLIVISSSPHQKKFFDIDYIFEDHLSSRKYKPVSRERPSTMRSSDKKHKTLEEQVDITKSIVQKTEDNFLKMSPVQQKKLLSMPKNVLDFSPDSKTGSIHARRFNTNLDLIKSWSNKKQQNGSTGQRRTFQGILTSRHFKVETSKGKSIEKDKRRSKIERLIKKLDSSIEMTKDSKKNSKIEGQEFRKYCEKNIEFAKNAFILKNKQMIRIYRPWSPIHIEEGFTDFEFGESSS